MASIPPNQTVYLRNLNDKIQKDVLKHSLYSLCIPYGQILDIVALKTPKMRGQAFVVFGDITSATAALRQLNGRKVFGKTIQAEYALSKSEVVSQSDGTFRFGEPRKHMSAKERKRLLGLDNEKSTKRRQSDSDRSDGPSSSNKRMNIGSGSNESDSDGEDDEHMAIESDSDGSEEIGPLPPKLSASIDAPEANAPNPTLFVTNIPKNISEEMISGLFQQYSGFIEVRRIAGKSDMAFVDYDTTASATAARDVLNGFKLSAQQAMKVEFSR
ncbi:U2 small nuclear ribonucleoprotein B'' [Coemansia interrupta]|uniref:U2 small nuclear ribonucleoprotein B n=1 Tax=Coemansia interrupta TaxID=1126814 RepID=A0A9W8HL62_9FUNG|nr:U2 small nuclear ribonucleoprotein B'' [Coemansia interrupta]